jgi:hypothetical protein
MTPCFDQRLEVRIVHQPRPHLVTLRVPLEQRRRQCAHRQLGLGDLAARPFKDLLNSARVLRS